ncbi:MAG: class I SAM-dependent methyltransferase [Proteobacteria bacterium]|jgi:SAM-dependent methyltransferase|nr:class I SAM-dependent methyltransferase [Pseudomonadota bacterium]
MGITAGVLEFFNRNLVLYPGLKMIELGDQEIYVGHELSYHWIKSFFELAGIDHTSIDINGKGGALPLDMSQPIPDSHSYLKLNFDVLTDIGFGEHVSNQYHLFKNAHDLVKPGGLFLHELPGQPYFDGHKECYYYRPAFFAELSRLNGYELLVNTLRLEIHYLGSFLCSVVMKKGPTVTDFINEETFRTLPIYTNVPMSNEEAIYLRKF